jgi:hypothetical protein
VTILAVILIAVGLFIFKAGTNLHKFSQEYDSAFGPINSGTVIGSLSVIGGILLLISG